MGVSKAKARPERSALGAWQGHVLSVGARRQLAGAKEAYLSMLAHAGLLRRRKTRRAVKLRQNELKRML